MMLCGWFQVLFLAVSESGSRMMDLSIVVAALGGRGSAGKDFVMGLKLSIIRILIAGSVMPAKKILVLSRCDTVLKGG